MSLEGKVYLLWQYPFSAGEFVSDGIRYLFKPAENRLELDAESMRELADKLDELNAEQRKRA